MKKEETVTIEFKKEVLEQLKKQIELTETENTKWRTIGIDLKLRLDKATEKTNPTHPSCHWFVID